MTKSILACPAAAMVLAMSAAAARSVRPGRSHCGTLACTRSIAAPASASAATSAGVFLMRSARSAEAARAWRAPGIASRNRSTIMAHIWPARPTVAGLPSRWATAW